MQAISVARVALSTSLDPPAVFRKTTQARLVHSIGSSAAGAALTLNITSGTSLQGICTLVFGSVAFGVTNDGDSTVTFNFELNDTSPTLTWDETP
jgi:hypothetical protein